MQYEKFTSIIQRSKELRYFSVETKLPQFKRNNGKFEAERDGKYMQNGH